MTDEERAKMYAITRTYPRFESSRMANFVLREVEGAFLAGLKAGRPQWHNVADGDLPKEQKEYGCKVFYYDSEETFRAFLWFDVKTKSFKFLEDIENGVEHGFNVKSWYEIPKYEED